MSLRLYFCPKNSSSKAGTRTAERERMKDTLVAVVCCSAKLLHTNAQDIHRPGTI